MDLKIYWVDLQLSFEILVDFADLLGRSEDLLRRSSDLPGSSSHLPGRSSEFCWDSAFIQRSRPLDLKVYPVDLQI